MKMKRAEKILAVAMVIVFFAGQPAYARWQDTLGFRSGPKLFQRKMEGAYKTINGNKVGRVFLAPTKLGVRTEKAAVSWVKKHTGVVAAGGATLATGSPVVAVGGAAGLAAGKSPAVRGGVIQAAVFAAGVLSNRANVLIIPKGQVSLKNIVFGLLGISEYKK